MKQVISSLSPEFTPVSTVDERKFYGVKFGTSDQTFPKLLLVHQDYFTVLLFGSGVQVDSASFLRDQKFTQLKPAIDFLLKSKYSVYEFDSFHAWYIWYSTPPKLEPFPAPIMSLKPKKKRKMSFRKDTKSHKAVIVDTYSATGEWIAYREAKGNNKPLWLTRAGLWQTYETYGAGLSEKYRFPSKAAVEAALDKLERQK